MNFKQLACYCLCGLGVLAIGYGFYAKSHISAAKAEVHKLATSKNPVVKSMGKKVEHVLGNYTQKVWVCFIGGIVLIVVGIGGAYRFRVHHKWW